MVANSAAPVSITVFANASAATANVFPIANISGSSTDLQGPQQIVLNSNVVNGELYVVDSVSARVLIYTNISITTGNLAPARILFGSSTGLVGNQINGIAIDPTR
jgi:hypothetical protein